MEIKLSLERNSEGYMVIHMVKDKMLYEYREGTIQYTELYAILFAKEE